MIICLSPWLFDDYLIDYLMIFFSEILIIWWLFDDYSNYLIIWWLFWLFWLFDDYLLFCSGSFQCSFLSHCHLVIMLGLPTLWATNYRQLEGKLKPGGDGEADTESSTGLCFGACPCAGFAAAEQSAWSLAMNADQRLGGTLRSCLLQKACCGSYRQKWENGQRGTWR